MYQQTRALQTAEEKLQSINRLFLNSIMEENKIQKLNILTWETRRWWLFVSRNTCSRFLQDSGLLSQQSLPSHAVVCAFLVRNWSGSSVMFGLHVPVVPECISGC